MKTEDSKIENKPLDDEHKERRNRAERRVSQGRRDMIRFDETGGDRRSGNARRQSDEGFREFDEVDDELDTDDTK